MPRRALASAAQDKRRAAIDRYGELKRRIREFQPIRDEYDKLSREIQSWYEDAPANQSYIAEGDLYNCQVSAREYVTEIKSLAAVFKHFGKAQFLELATIALGVLRKALPDELHSQFLDIRQTGKRRLTPVSKAVPIRPGKKAA